MLGLRWHKIQSARLDKRHELKNTKLAQALVQKQKFSNEEFAAFEIKDLRFDDYIKVGSDYFEPDLMSEETRLQRKELRKRPCMLALASMYGLLVEKK